MEDALRHAVMILGLYGPDSPHYRRAIRVLRRRAWLLVAEADDDQVDAGSTPLAWA